MSQVIPYLCLLMAGWGTGCGAAFIAIGIALELVLVEWGIVLQAPARLALFILLIAPLLSARTAAYLIGQQIKLPRAAQVAAIPFTVAVFAASGAFVHVITEALRVYEQPGPLAPLHFFAQLTGVVAFAGACAGIAVLTGALAFELPAAWLAGLSRDRIRLPLPALRVLLVVAVLGVSGSFIASFIAAETAPAKMVAAAQDGHGEK